MRHFDDALASNLFNPQTQFDRHFLPFSPNFSEKSLINHLITRDIVDQFDEIGPVPRMS